MKFVACASLALGAAAQAQDTKVNPAGAWIWSVPARNGGPDRTNTLTLKVQGDKVTGTLSMPRRGGEVVDTAIKDAKVNGEEISFTVTREFNGNTVTSKYSGKISGDAIKGKIATERDGETQSRDWDARRRMPKADMPEKAETK
jgi:hypothetical protein